MRNPPQLQYALAVAETASFGRIGRHHQAPSVFRTSLRESARETHRTPLRNEVEAVALRALAANGFGDAGRVGRADSGQSVRRAAGLISIAARLLSSCRALVRRTVAEWQRRQLERDTSRALHGLDDRTLRDLGIDRSEIRSLAAEVIGSSGFPTTRSMQALRRLR